jgi:hypothetical protein
MNALAQFPIFAESDNPARELDEIEIELADMHPWAACQAIEAKHLGGKLSIDDALVLLAMHSDRLALWSVAIECRIRGA